MNSPKTLEILEMVKENRILLGISQNYFSEKLNMSQSAYNALENGKVDISVSKLLEIIEKLKQESLLINKNSNDTFNKFDNLSKQLDILR
jgi:transcriptional regulator with XRE-family HTH domain